MKGILRATIQHSLAWSFCALYIPFVIAAVLLTAGRFPNAVNRPLIRFWGRMMLVFSGVKLELDASCEALKVREARVFTFNHASSLDLFIITSLFAPGSVAVVKREIVYIPFIGWAVYFMDFIRLDRRNRERALASLEATGKKMQEQRLSVFIAPEGTRTSSRAPAAFKLGAFRLAEISGAPIIPLVIDGAAELWPKNKLYCRGGTVKIRLLEPITNEALRSRGTRAIAEELRARYAKDLGVALAEPAAPLEAQVA